MFDFTKGVLPVGATLTRAAGPWSRTKRVEYTEYDFTSGYLPAGVSVQRAAGSWSRRLPSGAIELGTAADVPRFDYDPPIENRIPSSAVSQTKAYIAGTSSSDANGITTVVASATDNASFSAEYYTSGTLSSELRTFSVDLRGDVGGEVIYLIAQGNAPGDIQAYRRIVLTTDWRGYDLTVTGSMPVLFFEIGINNRGTAPREAVPAQTYYIRRRQLNGGPVSLAYVETGSTAIYVGPVCRGLLHEPGRTNYVLNSDVLTGNTVTGQVTFSNGVTSPTGSAVTRVGFAANSGLYKQFIRTIPANEAWVHSVFVTNSTDNSAINIGTNGVAAGLNNTALSYTLANGWSRKSYALTAAADNGLYSYIGTASFSGTPAQSAGYVDISGIQMERGAFPSSYIPTGVTNATRSTETIRIDDARIEARSINNYLVDIVYSDGTTQTRPALSGNGFLTLGSLTEPKTIRTLRINTIPSGLMELGSTANVPRFEYDPATGLSRGMLLEPTSTNLQLGSGVINDPNFRLYGTRSAGSNGPDGISSNRFKRNPTRTDGSIFDQYPSDYGSGANAVRTYSMYVKNVDAVSIHAIDVGLTKGVNYDFGTGSLTTTGSGVTPAVKAGPGGSIRLSTTEIKTNMYGYWMTFVDRASTTSTTTVDVSYIQLEAGSVMTSYIPTTTAAATRPAESLVLDWTSEGVVDGTYNIGYTFDDGTSQIIQQAIVSRKTTVPLNSLNRFAVKFIGILKTPATRTITPPARTGNLVVIL